MNRVRLLRHVITALILSVFLAHATGNITIPLLDTLEHQAYDFRVSLSRQSQPDPRVVIVDIDTQSLRQLGRWPWNRDLMAQLVKRLFDDYQISLLGFDVLFAEANQDSGVPVLQRLADGELKDNAAFQNSLHKLLPRLQYDRQFADAIADYEVVLGYYFTHANNKDGDSRQGRLPASLLRLNQQQQTIPWLQATGFGANLPALQQAALHGGFFNLPTVDDDGVIRSIPLVQRFDGQLYESLSLAMIRALLGFPELELIRSDDYQDRGDGLGLEAIKLGPFQVPTDERGVALVPYRGGYGSYPYVSAADILAGKAPAGALEGAVVLVGTSAPGLNDMRSMPLQTLYPGVEVHANMITGILDQQLYQRPSWVWGVNYVMMIAIAVALSLLAGRKTIIPLLAGSLSLSALLTGGVLYAWFSHRLVLPVAAQLSLLLVLFIYSLIYFYFVENRKKRELAAAFGQYIPPELVRELSDTDSHISMQGETRHMTVMFSDIRGFTSLSEGLSPKELTRMMNLYFTAMTEAVQAHRGTIDKYIGDAIMAFWGAPLPESNHASLALDAALSMHTRLRQLDEEFEKNGWPRLHIGIGINTGSMYVGNIGSEFRTAYTVLGDAVNLASRLEALTKRYDTPIIVAEGTRGEALDYVYRELDSVRVAGKEQPVSIYQPLGRKQDLDATTRQEVRDYQDALTLYRQQQWQAAREAFAHLHQAHPQQLYREYLRRCETYLRQPPGPDWDGVYIYQSK